MIAVAGYSRLRRSLHVAMSAPLKLMKIAPPILDLLSRPYHPLIVNCFHFAPQKKVRN